MTEDTQAAFPVTTALLEEAVRHRVFPGCAFGILSLRGSQPTETVRAVGRLTYDPDSSPVTPKTIFDLASLTKVLATTAAAMRLYEQGRLNLNAPLTDWLPEFAAADPTDSRRRMVTPRMLMDHSSGLPGYVRLFEQARDRAGIVEACLRQPLTADPGARTEYSDIGFILLGSLLERITGEDLDSYCMREIFAPLAMATSCFCPASAMRSAIPPTEDDRNFRHRVIQGEVHDENASAMGGVAGHAGLFSDAGDPLRFASCILTGGVPPSAGGRLFSAETIAHFAARSTQPAGSSRALGWDTPSAPSSSGNLFSARSIGHLGFTGTSLWIDRDANVAVCLLANRTWPDRSRQAIREVRPRFHDAIRRELANRISA